MNRQTQATFGKVLGRRRFLLQQSAPTQIVREVFCRHAMEPSHPFLQSAGIRVHILHMKHFLAHPLLLPEVHRLMGDPVLPGNRLVGQGAISAQKGVSLQDQGQDRRQRRLGPVGKHRIRCGAVSVPNDQDGNLFFRQPAFRGFSAPLPRRTMREVPLPLARFQKDRFIGLHDPLEGRVLRIPDLGQEPVPPPEGRRMTHPAPLRRFPDREAVLQGFGIHKPLFLVPKTGQGGPGQGVRRFPAGSAAIPLEPASDAPAVQVLSPAVGAPEIRRVRPFVLQNVPHLLPRIRRRQGFFEKAPLFGREGLQLFQNDVKLFAFHACSSFGIVWRNKNTMNFNLLREHSLLFFKKPIDTMPKVRPNISRSRNGSHILEEIRKFFFNAEWFLVYDFIEFTCQFHSNDPRFSGLPDGINQVFEREMAGYRLISGKIVDITDQQEIQMLEEALQEKDQKFSGVVEHLQRALELFSDRENPDYRNSIKESISAVESMMKVITGNPQASLEVGLNHLKKKRKAASP